ncbi:ComF family protein [Paenibacillus algorifonticola]|uniref:ComF family protein n=1 Tax=Paenibacillus algorifonticola TaxID=684063 RepID=UPI003D2D6F77
MNSITIYRLGQKLANFMGNTLGLLGPSAELCPLCGKIAKPLQPRGVAKDLAKQRILSASFAKLICGNCLENIPWIKSIKCRICGRAVACPDCIRRNAAAFVLNRSAVQYSEQMRELLAKYKYRGNETLEPYLGEMLLYPLTEMTRELTGRLGIRAGSPWSNIWHAITYVPVSVERAEERGFNQAERLAAWVSQSCGIPLVNLLARQKHSAKQSFKTRSERMRDMQNIFEVEREGLEGLVQSSSKSVSQNAPMRLLLVDDIFTTGSTIQACSETIQKGVFCPLEIYALTWARS